MEEEGYRNKRRVIERSVALRRVFQALMRERQVRKGWFEDCLPSSPYSPLWVTSINIVGGQSSVPLFKIQQVYIFNVYYGQVLNLTTRIQT